MMDSDFLCSFESGTNTFWQLASFKNDVDFGVSNGVKK